MCQQPAPPQTPGRNAPRHGLSIPLPAPGELDPSVESLTAPPFLSCSWADAHSGKYHAEFWLLKHRAKRVWKAQATLWLHALSLVAPCRFLQACWRHAWPELMATKAAVSFCTGTALSHCSQGAGLFLYWSHSWGTADCILKPPKDGDPPPPHCAVLGLQHPPGEGVSHTVHYEFPKPSLLQEDREFQ